MNIYYVLYNSRKHAMKRGIDMQTLLSSVDLKKDYKVGEIVIHALRGISTTLPFTQSCLWGELVAPVE